MVSCTKRVPNPFPEYSPRDHLPGMGIVPDTFEPEHEWPYADPFLRA